MKRFSLLLACVLLLPVMALAQANYLEQSTAVSIQIEAVLTTNAFLTTITSQGMSFALVKEDGTETTWVPTASGGTHDCTSKTYTLRCEIPAADVNQLGHLSLAWTGTNIYPGWKDFTVIATASKAVSVDGNVADEASIIAEEDATQALIGTPVATVSADIAGVATKTSSLTFTVANKLDSNVYTWNGTAVATPATAGYVYATIKDGTGTGELDTASGKVSPAPGSITVTEAPTLDAAMTTRGTYSFKAGANKQISMSFKAAGVPVTTNSAVTCKIAKDAPISSASGASHNAASNTTDYGSSELTLDGATDLTSVTDYINLHCEAGGIAVDTTVYLQP